MPLSPLWAGRPHRTVGIPVQKQLVQVQAHPPQGRISPPVPAADHFVGITEDVRSRASRCSTHLRSKNGNVRGNLAEHRNELALQPVEKVRARMLVSTLARIALRVMREPVLVRVHTDKVLETDGDSSLLVCLELR